jgi:hypothetical protein
MPSAFTRWFQQAGAPNPETFTPTKALYAAWVAWAERVGERGGGSVLWSASCMRAAGVEHHRTATTKGWHYRLADLGEVKASIKAATVARRNAHEAGDVDAKVAAIREEMVAKRRAGELLVADPGSPLQLVKATREHCIQLARLTDGAFAAKVEAVARRAVAALGAPHRGTTSPTIRMAITPWFRDSDGALTRTVMAVVEDTADADGRPQLET